MKPALVAVCLLAVTTVGAAAQTPPSAPRGAGPGVPDGPRPAAPKPPTPYDVNNHPGWTSMFDGTTLKDWAGPMESWRVEDGAISSSQSAANPQGSVYLYWTGNGGQVRDFEFKTEIKMAGEGANSGIQFRAAKLGKTEKKNSGWESRGYQADYTYNGGAVGSIIECCRGPGRGVPPRPEASARAGLVVRSPVAEGESATVLATIGDPVEMKKVLRIGDWNEIHLIVRGRTIMYLVNGQLMSVLIDDSQTMFNDHGELAIQLEGRGDTKVWFRNMWIKPLN